MEPVSHNSFSLTMIVVVVSSISSVSNVHIYWLIFWYCVYYKFRFKVASFASSEAHLPLLKYQTCGCSANLHLQHCTFPLQLKPRESISCCKWARVSRKLSDSLELVCLFVDISNQNLFWLNPSSRYILDSFSVHCGCFIKLKLHHFHHSFKT